MKELKGSKKCMLELISSPNYYSTINSLIQGTEAIITAKDDKHFPLGLHNDKEAELKDFLAGHFTAKQGTDIRNWWLAVSTPNTRTPNWDLISTCTINGKKGILLVEAKAHKQELNGESHGKKLKLKPSDDSISNHGKIGLAINEAREGIDGISISRDNCYQLSNRVAHAWWLANQGIPVVLLYLGFLNVKDMDNGKNKLLETNKDWTDCFSNHASKVGVDNIIDKWVDCGKSGFRLICKSI